MQDKYDVLYWLRRSANVPYEEVMVGPDLLVDAADEIEHLRALITEFHNADLAELAAPPWEAEQTMRRRLDAENALYDAAERWSE